jgi:predicted ester cyclase
MISLKDSTKLIHQIMDLPKEQKNKEFILRYTNAMNGQTKNADKCDEFMTDQKLKEHILFFDTIFPQYTGEIEEMLAEGDKVMLRVRLKGVHKGLFNGIPPTYKKVKFPLVITYTIREGKIVDHWLIADEMELLQQLGVMPAIVETNEQTSTPLGK